MTAEYDLHRFLSIQDSGEYECALAEIRAGRKQGHWIWFVFPQIAGLGHSYMAEKYAITDLREAIDYLRHPVLGARLQEISRALLECGKTDPEDILGGIDAIKVRSSMTLFLEAMDASGEDGAGSVFRQVIDTFYKGKIDDLTIAILAEQAKRMV